MKKSEMKKEEEEDFDVVVVSFNDGDDMLMQNTVWLSVLFFLHSIYPTVYIYTHRQTHTQSFGSFP